MSLRDPSKDPETDAGRFARWSYDYLKQLRTNARDSEDFSQFFAFAAGHARDSKGQLFQDLWALWEKGDSSGGFFVEFGAANGINHSNTYLLERKFGWSGILAEPNPTSLPALRKNRACKISDKCVFSKSGVSLAFQSAASDQLSRIASIVPDDSHERDGRRTTGMNEVMVETISLNDLLVEYEAPQTIDYLSVDTEGSEFEILSQFDFAAWDVRCISVEHNYSSMRDKLNDLLVGAGYRRKWPEFSRFDDWYVKAS